MRKSLYFFIILVNLINAKLAHEELFIIDKMTAAVDELYELTQLHDIKLEHIHASKKLIQHAIERPWRQAEGKFWHYNNYNFEEMQKAQKVAYALIKNHYINPSYSQDNDNAYVGICAIRLIGARSFLQAHEYFEQLLEQYTCNQN